MATDKDLDVFRGGSGPRVLLLHGATGSWRHWRPVLPALTERYEVIAPTLSGHFGGPPWPEGVRTFSDITDALERQLDDLGVEPVHIVGNSLGGALAIALAARGGARSVVALSPAAGWESGAPEAEHVARFFERAVRDARRSRRIAPLVLRAASARRAAFRHVVWNGEAMTPRDAINMARSTAEFTQAQTLTRALRTGDDALPQGLDRIIVPVLLAWSEKDWVLPPEAASARYRRAIPNAEFRMLPNVGHLPMWDDPELVVATVNEWIDRVESIPANR